MSRLLRRALIATATVLAVAHAAAQPLQSFTVEEATVLIDAELRRQRESDALLDQAVRRGFGDAISPEKAAVARANLRTLFLEERLAPRLAQMLVDFVGVRKLTPDEAKALAMELASHLQFKGLRRLSVEERAGLLRLNVQMLRQIPAEQCQAMMLGRMRNVEVMAIERRFDAARPQAEFEHIQSLSLKAGLAELHGSPAVLIITPEQRRLANEALGKARSQRANRLPMPLLRNIASLGVAGAPPSDACEFLSTVREAPLDLQEPYRTWILQGRLSETE